MSKTYFDYLTEVERIAIEDLGYRIREFKVFEEMIREYRQSLEEELRNISMRAYFRTKR
jgi:hypothetical protein